MFQFTIKVADIILRVNSEIDLNRFTDLSIYHAFKTVNSLVAHCQLDLRLGLPSLAKRKKSIFNPAGNWKLSKTDKGSVLEIGVPDKKGVPDEIVILNADYTHGIVYKKNIFELFRYFLDQFFLMNLLSRRGGFLLHSCGLIWEKEGLVFSGPSGAGKSTLLKLFSARVDQRSLLNDDRIAVRKCGSQWKIFGTPWHGEFPVVSAASAPLKAIYFIKHSTKNYLRPLSGAQTFQTLFQHSLIPYWDEPGLKEILNSFELLTQEIPAYELGVVPDRHIIEFVTSGF